MASQRETIRRLRRELKAARQEKKREVKRVEEILYDTQASLQRNRELWERLAHAIDVYLDARYGLEEEARKLPRPAV